MKREIKFRAWDGENKKMRVIEFPDSVVNLSITNSVPFADTVTLNPYECKWMQYTGLKDKNGREIFEGDVVEYSERIDSENEKQRLIQGADRVYFAKEKGVVEWDTEGADFQISFQNGCERGFNARGTGIELEIIGNIYENPELLTNN